MKTRDSVRLLASRGRWNLLGLVLVLAAAAGLARVQPAPEPAWVNLIPAWNPAPDHGTWHHRRWLGSDRVLLDLYKDHGGSGGMASRGWGFTAVRLDHDWPGPPEYDFQDFDMGQSRCYVQGEILARRDLITLIDSWSDSVPVISYRKRGTQLQFLVYQPSHPVQGWIPSGKESIGYMTCLAGGPWRHCDHLGRLQPSSR